MAEVDSITPPEYRVVPGGIRLIYRVGTDGTFWSSKDGGQTWKQLRPCAQRSGHCRVFLGRGHQGFRFLHRLILETFVGSCPPGMEACHKNDDPRDNRLENLYWGSRQENMDDRVRNGRTSNVRGENSPKAKLTEANVLDVVRMAREGVKQKEIAVRIGTTHVNVQAILYGLSWSHLTGITPRKYRYPKKASA